jgi:ribonuclease R
MWNYNYKQMKNKKHTSHKNEQKLLDLGRKILRFMNQKTSKIYNYKQIAEGIDYKNQDKENW